MRLIIDMDGVLVDMLSSLVEQYNHEFAKSMTVADITQWKLPDGMHEIFKRPGFFRHLKPYDGAVEAIKTLGRNHRIVIATDCLGISCIKEDKEVWLRAHIWPYIQGAEFTGEKHLIVGDLILDDGPHHLAAWPGLKVCMDRPYNRDAEADYRVHDMMEFVALVGKLSGK